MDPVGLAGLQFRRFSIFNDCDAFGVVNSTPKLYLFKEGRATDLMVEESLKKLLSSAPGEGDEGVLV